MYDLEDASLPAAWEAVRALPGLTLAPWVETSTTGELRVCRTCKSFWHLVYDPKENCYTRALQLGPGIEPLLRANSPVEKVWPLALRGGDAEFLVHAWLQSATYDPEESLRFFVAEIGRHVGDGERVVRLLRCVRFVLFGLNPWLRKRLEARTNRAPIFRIPNASPLLQILKVPDLFRGATDDRRAWLQEQFDTLLRSFSQFGFRPGVDWIEVAPEVRCVLVARYGEGNALPVPERTEATPTRSLPEVESTPTREPPVSFLSRLALTVGVGLLIAIGGVLFGTHTVSTASWERGGVAAGVIGLAFTGVVWLSGCRSERVAFRAALAVTLGIAAWGHLTHYDQKADFVYRQIQSGTEGIGDPAWSTLAPKAAYRAYVERELAGGTPFFFLDHLRLHARQGTVTREWMKHSLPRYAEVERVGFAVWWGWLLQVFEIFVACFLGLAWVLYGTHPPVSDPSSESAQEKTAAG